MMFLKIFSRLKFTNPSKNGIVILYSDDYWIRRLVLKDLHSTTLDPYPERIYVTPVLVARTLLRLRMVKWFGTGAKPFLKDLLRQIYVQYVLACIDQTGAEVVLTYIDNSPLFQQLSRIDRKRTYFAIQNGTRTLACVRDSLASPHHPSPTISMTNFFCFGQRDADLFRKHGHKVDAYIPVGSLVGGYYKSLVSAPVAEPKFDLCLISQWHQHHFAEIAGSDFAARMARRVGAGIRGLNSFLGLLLDETDLTLVVCPRNDHDAAEVFYFSDIFGERVRIAESDRRNFSTYRIVDQSRLAIGLNSTMLAEAFAYGQKVLWCNTPSDEHFEMPEAGISYFHGNDYDAFKERVLTLLQMPQEEYATLTRVKARYINNYDPACPPHEAIRASVLKALSRVD